MQKKNFSAPNLLEDVDQKSFLPGHYPRGVFTCVPFSPFAKKPNPTITCYKALVIFFRKLASENDIPGGKLTRHM